MGSPLVPARLFFECDLADLAGRVGGLDAECNWAEVLSQGEQQRLAFGRLMLNLPRFAFLDEATSALDKANETMLYRRLLQSPIILVSVGHRESLTQYHDLNLELTGNGGWEIHRLKEPPASTASGSP